MEREIFMRDHYNIRRQVNEHYK